jgi:hypothetical protein
MGRLSFAGLPFSPRFRPSLRLTHDEKVTSQGFATYFNMIIEDLSFSKPPERGDAHKPLFIAAVEAKVRMAAISSDLRSVLQTMPLSLFPQYPIHSKQSLGW